MADRRARNEFVARLIVPTAVMAASLWYLGSLWDARMRAQNLILIQPVVVAMIPFYLWVIGFEIRRYRAVLRGEDVVQPAVPANRDHLKFMALAVATVVLFHFFGAVPATLVALVASLLILRINGPLILIGVPLVTTAVLWLVFIRVFGIRMPLFLAPW